MDVLAPPRIELLRLPTIVVSKYDVYSQIWAGIAMTAVCERRMSTVPPRNRNESRRYVRVESRDESYRVRPIVALVGNAYPSATNKDRNYISDLGHAQLFRSNYVSGILRSGETPACPTLHRCSRHPAELGPLGHAGRCGWTLLGVVPTEVSGDGPPTWGGHQPAVADRK